VFGVIVYDLGEGPVTESREHGNEISDFKKCGHFLSKCAKFSFRRLTVLHGVSKLVSHKDNVCVKIKFGVVPKKERSTVKI